MLSALPRGLISVALSRTRKGTLALWSKRARVRPPIPAPAINTLGFGPEVSGATEADRISGADILVEEVEEVNVYK